MGDLIATAEFLRANQAMYGDGGSASKRRKTARRHLKAFSVSQDVAAAGLASTQGDSSSECLLTCFLWSLAGTVSAHKTPFQWSRAVRSCLFARIT